MSAYGQPPQPSEEELRALEAELDRITVDDVVLQTIVSLVNLAARKAGLASPPGEAPAPDWEQTRQAIDAVRALLALVEPRHSAELGPIRDAISQLQMHYAKGAGGQAGPVPGAERAPASGEKGPAGPGRGQSSGRLWVPGQ